MSPAPTFSLRSSSCTPWCGRPAASVPHACRTRETANDGQLWMRGNIFVRVKQRHKHTSPPELQVGAGLHTSSLVSFDGVGPCIDMYSPFSMNALCHKCYLVHLTACVMPAWRVSVASLRFEIVSHYPTITKLSERRGDASCYLAWSSPSVAYGVVPPANLYW